ncbi:MAG TPA: outer membrane protein [Xanthobacteraceae bacterium]
MNRLMLTGIALASLAVVPAMAADLTKPAPIYTKAPVMAPPYSWTGFYIGLNGGYSWGRSGTDFLITGVPAGSTAQNMDGWLGGGQIGYNWQSGTWLLGVEADIQATGQNGTLNLTTPTSCPVAIGVILPCTTGSASIEQKLPWFGTLRARVGVTPSASWLLYVTGGLAFGEVDTTATFTSATAFAGGLVLASTTTAANSNTTKAGWVIGGGVEWTISGPWTAKLEYLYMDLGTVSTSFAGPAPFTLVATNSRITDNILRVGVNYRFGGSPVVARY